MLHFIIFTYTPRLASIEVQIYMHTTSYVLVYFQHERNGPTEA